VKLTHTPRDLFIIAQDFFFYLLRISSRRSGSYVIRTSHSFCHISRGRLVPTYVANGEIELISLQVVEFLLALSLNFHKVYSSTYNSRAVRPIRFCIKILMYGLVASHRLRLHVLQYHQNPPVFFLLKRSPCSLVLVE